jgi:hypothetical protein
MEGSLEDKLRRLVEGDAEAKQWLYDRFAGRLYRKLTARYGGHGQGLRGGAGRFARL